MGFSNSLPSKFLLHSGQVKICSLLKELKIDDMESVKSSAINIFVDKKFSWIVVIADTLCT